MKWTILAPLLATAWQGAFAAELKPLLADSGLWQGVGVQLGGENWAMQVQLGPEVSMIDYPGLACSGEWKYIRQTPEALTAIEDITNGDDVCVTGGVVRLEALAEDMLAYTWLDAAGKPAAVAVLIPGLLQDDLYGALLDLTRQTMDTARMETPEAAADVNEATDL
jgi:hypothetical protein